MQKVLKSAKMAITLKQVTISIILLCAFSQILQDELCEYYYIRFAKRQARKENYLEYLFNYNK